MAGPVTNELRVNGMTCNNCARRVTDALQAVPGVHSVSVNVEQRQAIVRWGPGAQAETAPLVAALALAGYPAEPAELGSPETSTAARPWHANLWLGGAVTAVLLAGEWVFAVGLSPWFQWLAFALAGAVQVVGGASFYRGAWAQLKVGRSNMDTLVALGSTTAFGYSTWALFTNQGGHVYFMEAAAIITLISIGHWLEARVSLRASAALRSLLHLAPATARRLETKTSPGTVAKFDPLAIRSFKPQAAAAVVETEVPVTQLQIGDRVALRPGDRVPVDGVVTEGESAVDESMLTGESVPVDKHTGDEVYAGTMTVNGRLTFRVTATGEATALANIIAAVQRAQTSRANIQRLGDQVSAVFVPIVVALALAAGLWWGFAADSAMAAHEWLARWLWPAHPPAGPAAAFVIAAAVLIIACPCAMGLATPAAIMASANAAAKRGILIRDGVALEKAGLVTTVVFDKTGTLTSGKPELVAAGVPSANSRSAWTVFRGAGMPALMMEAGDDSSALTVFTVAAALARHSTHPVSQALVRGIAPALAVGEWREVRGAGVEGVVQAADCPLEQLLPAFRGSAVRARLGSIRWLREAGVDLAAGDPLIAEWSQKGATVLGLTLENSLAGLLMVRDTLKPGAAAVVAQLTRQNLRVCLLTGDNARTAASIAQQAGIAPENVAAEVRPEQKAEFVKELQARGERVAFVGDGINDAPALTQADLGIAVSRASDVAREAADVILLKSEIEAVPEALGLARATLRAIKQNLFWAFFYNAVGVPLAALGFMSPVLCAAAMGCSDLLVIGNALRLRRWRLPATK